MFEFMALMVALGLDKLMVAVLITVMTIHMFRSIMRAFVPDARGNDEYIAGDEDAFEEDQENGDPWEKAVRAAELRQRQHYREHYLKARKS